MKKLTLLLLFLFAFQSQAQEKVKEGEIDFEINTEEELNEFCLKYYCWNQSLEEWIENNTDFYNKMKGLIEKNYSILKFDIDYSDDYLNEEIHNLINSNDERTILIEEAY